jgi:hypothetical protein
MGRRHTRTAGTSQRRPRGSLPLARGGAGCSAGGDRNPRRGGVAEGPSARSVPRAAFELRQPADVVLVEMGQHRSSPIGEVVADGLQPGGERIAGADVEARGEAVVEESQVAPPGK